MSLLRQIQDAAMSSEKPIGDLLRMCKVLASRLESKELSDWVDRELNGYADRDDLPAYRIVKVNAAGHFSGAFGRALKNAPIPASCLPNEFRDWARVSYLTQPISAYGDAVRHKERSDLHIPWPADLVAYVGDKIYQDMNCLSAWQVLPRGAVVGLIDSVRNRVLNFALEIEKTAPDAGERSHDSPPVSKEQVSHVFHTYIYGNVSNIASGSESVTQTADVHVEQGDFASLKAQLSKIGLGDEDVLELQQAVEKDSAKKKGIGEAVNPNPTFF